MSKHEFDDNCRGCKPALIDFETGRTLPDDSPVMVAVMKYWETTTLEQRKAFHAVCCQNSREPHDLEIVHGLNKGMEQAMNEVIQS